MVVIFPRFRLDNVIAKMLIQNLGTVRPSYTKTPGDFVEILKHIDMKNRFLACLAISVSFYKIA